MLIAQIPQRFQELRRAGTYPAFALNRLDQDRRSLRSDGALDRLDVVERHLIEAVDDGAEAFQIFLLPARGERRQGTAVKRARESDDAITFRAAVDRMEFARGLDR